MIDVASFYKALKRNEAIEIIKTVQERLRLFLIID